MELETAIDVSLRERRTHKVVTFVEGLDSLFGGGVPLGRLTEFYGVPGIGRTQLCLQLAVNAHIPESIGGVCGDCLYIDTEGSFTRSRLESLADALVSHLIAISPAGTAVPTQRDIVSGTHLMRSLGPHELIAAVNALPRILDERPSIKLVIVDSVSFPFQHSGMDSNMAMRTRLLCALSQQLSWVAHTRQIAAVMTNQMTVRLDGSDAHIVPCLGDSFGHSSAFRARLFWADGLRFATIDKSPDFVLGAPLPPAVPFTIEAAGVRSAALQKQQ